MWRVALACIYTHVRATAPTRTRVLESACARARAYTYVRVRFILNNTPRSSHTTVPDRSMMPRLSYELRARIMNMWRAKFTVKEIVERLAEEGVKTSRTTIYNLLSKFQKTNSIADIKRRPRSRRLDEEHYRFVDETMAQNTDLSSRQLYAMFKTTYPSIEASLSTVKRARRDLGWTMKRTRYCQLISDVNKEKRMEWCLDRVISNDLELSDVIWTDECSIQLESHRKITYHKRGEPSKMVCTPKHPPKVHMWAGISAKGARAVVTFTQVS